MAPPSRKMIQYEYTRSDYVPYRSRQMGDPLEENLGALQQLGAPPSHGPIQAIPYQSYHLSSYPYEYS